MSDNVVQLPQKRQIPSVEIGHRQKSTVTVAIDGKKVFELHIDGVGRCTWPSKEGARAVKTALRRAFIALSRESR